MFIDETICDMQYRVPLAGTPAFYAREKILKDAATPGSVECVRELARQYTIVYLGARPEATVLATRSGCPGL